MISPDFARSLAEEWIAAWNAHDLERVLSHYEPDFEMASPRIVDIVGEPSGVLRGHASVGAYWQRALQMIPDLHFDLLDVFVGARSVALMYRNQAGRGCLEMLELGASGRIARAAAHDG